MRRAIEIYISRLGEKFTEELNNGENRSRGIFFIDGETSIIDKTGCLSLISTIESLEQLLKKRSLTDDQLREECANLVGVDMDEITRIQTTAKDKLLNENPSPNSCRKPHNDLSHSSDSNSQHMLARGGSSLFGGSSTTEERADSNSSLTELIEQINLVNSQTANLW